MITTLTIFYTPSLITTISPASSTPIHLTMPSFKTIVLAVAAALVSTVHADYQIDPNSVPLNIRQSWCSSELSTCPIICDQTAPFKTEVNTCDAVSLFLGAT